MRPSNVYPAFERIAGTRLFWIVTAIITLTLGFIGVKLDMTYLGFPQTLLIIASLQLLGILTLSVLIGSLYLRFHKLLTWLTRRHEIRYYKTDAFPFIFPKIRSMLKTSIVNVVGMTYLVVSTVSFIGYSQVTGSLALILIFLALLMLVPALNVSTMILRRSGVMYENPRDGTRMNLGVDLAKTLQWAIGPLALARFAYLEISGFTNGGVGFFLLALTIAVAVPALTLTYFMSKQALPRLSAKLDVELAKIL